MSEAQSIGALWRGWRDVLDRLGFATAALDAKLLTGHALGLDALGLALRERDAVPAEAVTRVAELLQRRMSGESVARIIGEKDFFGLTFGLNAATLEPRPDTELLVELALERLPQGGRLLDLGTGTGCIPISILASRADATGLATDLSAEALAMARANATRHGVEDRLAFAQGSWFAALAFAPPAGRSAEKFDLILSNPPYITSAVVETLAPEVKDFDPRLALDGGPDGLAPYRVIAAEAAHFLRPGGWVMVEIGHDQGASVPALLAQQGFGEIGVHKDLNGLDRVVVAHHLGDN
ncbi:peptide chain release factor N(5)-glutamine methyltransferase [Devosia salina]|uniref:Release factor glutamine methyltransferase n=1 Tax=Devosia salina TaxID=2860336 RepID=A0ABX8WJU1_9HYPH|nr:peptide chain release factor N(5)-glutamine methyltransferase [Devosia salina]